MSNTSLCFVAISELGHVHVCPAERFKFQVYLASVLKLHVQQVHVHVRAYTSRCSFGNFPEWVMCVLFDNCSMFPIKQNVTAVWWTNVVLSVNTCVLYTFIWQLVNGGSTFVIVDDVIWGSNRPIILHNCNLYTFCFHCQYYLDVINQT